MRMAELLRQLGYLEKGHLVHAMRDDLVAEYIGQTAPKTKKVLERAMGGVLFIDEAYYLYRGLDSRDYGQEAVDILLQVMENERDKLVVILAGYRDRMDTFFTSNPGMNSRIAHHLDFAEYDVDELVAIGRMMLGQAHYYLSDDAETAFRRYASAHIGGDVDLRVRLHLPARGDVRDEIALLHLLETNVHRLLTAFERGKREAAGYNRHDHNSGNRLSSSSHVLLRLAQWTTDGRFERRVGLMKIINRVDSITFSLLELRARVAHIEKRRQSDAIAPIGEPEGFPGLLGGALLQCHLLRLRLQGEIRTRDRGRGHQLLRPNRVEGVIPRSLRLRTRCSR